MCGRLRRSIAERRDAGMTITELAVVMLILGIVVAATATVSIGFMRTNAENVSRQDQLDMARMAVERMSETARTAVKPSQLTTSCTNACGEIDAFMEGKDLSVRFYANFDNNQNRVGPSRVTYTVGVSGAEAGVLTEKVQTPEDYNPSTPVVEPGPNGYVYCDAENPLATEACKAHLTTRRLAEGVKVTSPVFAYYGPDGTRLSTGTTGLAPDELENVLSIELVLTVQSTNVTKPQPTTYIQRVTLPNAQAVLKQGEDEDE